MTHDPNDPNDWPRHRIVAEVERLRIGSGCNAQRLVRSLGRFDHASGLFTRVSHHNRTPSASDPNLKEKQMTKPMDLDEELTSDVLPYLIEKRADLDKLTAVYMHDFEKQTSGEKYDDLCLFKHIYPFLDAELRELRAVKAALMERNAELADDLEELQILRELAEAADNYCGAILGQGPLAIAFDKWRAFND